MISVVVGCDGTGCTVKTGFAFEYAIETYACLVEALRREGWLVLVNHAVIDNAKGVATFTDGAIQRRTRCFCPDHARELERKLYPDKEAATP